jgi:hypothetical protein
LGHEFSRAFTPGRLRRDASKRFHFLPDPQAIVDRLLVAANRQVIFSEPVRNLADQNNPILRWLARKFTNPGTGDQARRFDESSFDRFFARHQSAGYVQAVFSSLEIERKCAF